MHCPKAADKENRKGSHDQMLTLHQVLSRHQYSRSRAGCRISSNVIPWKSTTDRRRLRLLRGDHLAGNTGDHFKEIWQQARKFLLDVIEKFKFPTPPEKKKTSVELSCPLCNRPFQLHVNKSGMVVTWLYFPLASEIPVADEKRTLLDEEHHSSGPRLKKAA